jgi:hypothetical protein
MQSQPWADQADQIIAQLPGIYGDLAKAELTYRQRIHDNPEPALPWLDLANVLLAQGQLPGAIDAYQQALARDRYSSQLHLHLGAAYYKFGNDHLAHRHWGLAAYYGADYGGAIAHWEELPLDQELAYLLADAHSKTQNLQGCIGTYYRGIAAGLPGLYAPLATTLHYHGYTEEAHHLAQTSPGLLWEKYLLLPQVYSSATEVEFYRQRFSRGLQQLIQQAQEPALGWELISRNSLFYLICQGENDRPLNQRWGEYVCSITRQIYPQWTAPLDMPKANGKIKIGYIANTMHPSGLFTLIMGWLRHADRQDFAIYCYYTGQNLAGFQEWFIPCSDYQRHLPPDVEQIASQIRADDLHILIFAAIGMDPLMTILGSLRLAPVQCATWLHPVTTGLPTIDYFLSSRLMESEWAASHYTEKLITFPNTGLSCGWATPRTATRPRSYYGLTEGAIVYLSFQSIFKYLPQYDYVFAEIVRRVPHAQIIFIGSAVNENMVAKFQHRLGRMFWEYGLDFQQFCRVIPLQPEEDYLNWYLLADVFLDTFSWSGGSTTLHAVGSSLPVVTCPGELARGRYSYGILQMMGMPETIATNPSQYIEIAVRLGLDVDWRRTLADSMLERHRNLGNEVPCVRYLESFYRSLLA